MTEDGLFDFKDGNGPVAAHRHPNGGGWVAETAYVSDTARVTGSAVVFHDAKVTDSVRILENARVFGNAEVRNYAHVFGFAWVHKGAMIFDSVRVYGRARVSNAWITGCAQIKSEIGVGLNGATFSCGQFTATVNDSFIQIGCEERTVSGWLKVSRRDAVRMGLDRHLYEQYMSFVRMVAAYQAKAEE